MADTPEFKTFSFGSCDVARIGPPIEDLDGDNRAINIALTFEDALKLNLAIDECVRQLNRYKRSTTAGKRTGLNLCLYLDRKRISVNVAKLPKGRG
jgi:hypothetical protein